MSTTWTCEDASASSRAAPRSEGFYEKLVMHTMKGFVHGGLKMVLPDGSVKHLGDPAATATAEMRILKNSFFKRCALFGNVGFGEAYVEGDWETESISKTIEWFILNISSTRGSAVSSSELAFVNVLKAWNRVQHMLRPNSVDISRKNIAEHYDLGNEFYSLWLDETMTYSSARYERVDQDLSEAQLSKYEALCQKLQLKPDDHVLEIGCGWGGFSSYAARTYGCRMTAVTISREQHHYATDRMTREGLSDRVEILLQDYRHITGKYDKIVSIEMLEAVGDAYVETYFSKCAEVLKPEGLLAFQVITTPDCGYKALRKGVDWIQKHIFPGSLLMSIGRVNQAINRTSDLSMHGMEDIGYSYALTLRAWFERFNAQLHAVRALGFDDRFIRKWNFYLQYCEAAFRSRNISVVQAVYTRPNNHALNPL